jgi:hypothetical protein
MKKIKARNLHRDLGYFYIGLIVSFAFSGLMMNPGILKNIQPKQKQYKLVFLLRKT